MHHDLIGTAFRHVEAAAPDDEPNDAVGVVGNQVSQALGGLLQDRLVGVVEGPLHRVVVGQFRLKPGLEPHPIHKHPEEEIMIVTGGTGEISCDGKTAKVGAGSVMYTAPNAPHGIKNTGTDVLTFYFVKWIGQGKQDFICQCRAWALR
ncbi:MAG: cupin domain-containing protein [Gemmataceae bacterium]|nr:cupin domain-containing protein [Gemmataceae bacterium]